MENGTEKELRQQAADRLMTHLLQKGGRPAPYKERLIGGLANPVPGCMPDAVTPIAGNGPLGVLQRFIFALEGLIRRQSDTSHQKMPDGSKQTFS
jgi:hypothetical protein